MLKRTRRRRTDDTRPKRPYSHAFRTRGVPRRYLLSGIPPTLWDRARTRALKENLSMRTMILGLIADWLKSPEPETGWENKPDLTPHLEDGPADAPAIEPEPEQPILQELAETDEQQERTTP